MRRYLLSALIRAARSLARLCWSRNAWCSRSQRPRMLPSMPIASITSALRRLLLASWPDLIDNSPALASGAGGAFVEPGEAIRASAPTSESRPSQGSKREDHQQVDREPGRVEEGEQRLAGDELAQGG